MLKLGGEVQYCTVSREGGNNSDLVNKSEGLAGLTLVDPRISSQMEVLIGLGQNPFVSSSQGTPHSQPLPYSTILPPSIIICLADPDPTHTAMSSRRNNGRNS